MNVSASFQQRIISAAVVATLTVGVTGLATASPEQSILTKRWDRGSAHSDPYRGAQLLPTGHRITPLAIPGAIQQLLNPGLTSYPDFVAGGAVRSELSPDGGTLAVLCAGQNVQYFASGDLDRDNSTQYIFLYDVAGERQRKPVLTQVIKQTNAHVGLVWAPDGGTLYSTGGNDDAVYAYAKSGAGWAQSAKIALGHIETDADGNVVNRNKGVGLSVQPNAGGLAISADGKTLVVANNYNDSISVIDTATRSVRYEHDLRPYFENNEGEHGAAGGTFPFAVALTDNGIAYVSANRDREVVVVDVSSPDAGRLVKRIKLDGNPLGMTLDASQARLYVAQDNSDQVAVVDTATDAVIDRIDTRAPKGVLPDDGQTGASPFSVKISPDGETLYAVNDGANSIAVISLRGNANRVVGLIPTAYAPRDISFSADGSWMYIVNGKSKTGPNTGHLTGYTYGLTSSTYPGGDPTQPAVETSEYPFGGGCDEDCQADNVTARDRSRGTNDYQFQLEQSSLVSAPVPSLQTMKKLTRQVASNNYYDAKDRPKLSPTMRFLQGRIKHIIYVVKENRTFDQVLGDLSNGSDGDPSLTVFGEAITPSQHKLARSFVTLDNFYDPGDGSMDGWSWTMQGRVTSTEGLTQQINYSAGLRGLSYESEGSNRNVPVNWETVDERDAAAGPEGTTVYTDAATAADLPGGVDNLLPGARNHASTDAPFGEEDGYIFNAVLEAGGTVRNYGFVVRNFGERVEDPFGTGEVQVGPLDPSLPRADFASAGDELPAGSTDVYFRGYDQVYPDLWRYDEWKREFDLYVQNGKLPSLTLFRISHDHMGSFDSALAGVNTPETQQADNDLALGMLVEAVAKSPYAQDTLIISIQDDCQDGPDHVDSHRTTVYVAGPYLKKGAVVSTPYTQVNVLRTIEDILGTKHINLNTAYQRSMDEIFDIKASADWSYEAVASTVLMTTSLDVAPDVEYAQGPAVAPKRSAEYWAKATSELDFSEADLINPTRYNRILWNGLVDGKPYPRIHSLWTSTDDD